MPGLEQGRLSALNAARNRKQNISQQLRGGLLRNSQSSQDESTDESQQPSIYKNKLALLKAGAIKEANSQAGAAAGTTVGGFVGSILPGPGTAIGAFIGRFIGKKLGITGIIIMSILMIILFIVLFIVMLKAGCNKTYGAQWIIGLHDMCTALGE